MPSWTRAWTASRASREKRPPCSRRGSTGKRRRGKVIPKERGNPDDPIWLAWDEKAREETRKMIEASKDNPAKIKIQTALYKAAKPFLAKLFGGKCAYCEVIIEVSHPTEGEHYRPKGNVTDEK